MTQHWICKAPEGCLSENSCIIHESVLCAKLKCVYAELMLRVMKKSQVSVKPQT